MLEEFDNTRASTGDKFASYRVQRLEDERVAYNRKSADLETMIEALANIKTYGETWSVLNTFADNIGEVKGTLATKLERTRKLLKLEGYVGEEPKNDFDRCSTSGTNCLTSIRPLCLILPVARQSTD